MCNKFNGFKNIDNFNSQQKKRTSEFFVSNNIFNGYSNTKFLVSSIRLIFKKNFIQNIILNRNNNNDNNNDDGDNNENNSDNNNNNNNNNNNSINVFLFSIK